MYDKKDKAELIRVAAQLKDIADQLLECAKEKKNKDDDDEDEYDGDSTMLKAVKLSKKLG